MRRAGDEPHALRIRALIAILWRAGLRIDEALQVAESDLYPDRGSLVVRHAKGGKRREVGMDDWGWNHAHAWRAQRETLPAGPLPCVIEGRSRGQSWSATAARARLRRLAADAGVRRRFDLGVTSIYLQGIDAFEIVNAVHTRRAPVISATAGLQL